MVAKKIFFIFGFFLFVIVGCVFISADFSNCWEENSLNGGTKTSCNAAGCLWATNDPVDVTMGNTDLYDPFCDPSYSAFCCFPNQCWQHDGDETSCLSSSDSLNCTWDPFMTIYLPNGTGIVGGCFNDWTSGNDTWGGVTEGCWQYDGDKNTCTSGANSATCSWSANDMNQNPWCNIKTLTDAQSKNSLATVLDIGCCEQVGCWSYDNNQTACEAAFQGNCVYDDFGGWCYTKSCSEITTEANCTFVEQNLYMPCGWNLTETDSCEDIGGGGFSFFNDSDSCFDSGGWYNSSGGCEMPSGGGIGGGSGGFMFGGDAHCWFADNQPAICNNITGCAYCISGSGEFGVSNDSANNICYNKQIGFCEGRNSYGPQDTYSNANNSANLACLDIQVKTACNYGPLPNCKWTNSSAAAGAYCESGASSEKKSAPPVQYCEDPTSKNNYTLCLQLANNYMMPCKWQNTTYPITNCSFNEKAVFGTDEDKDFETINSQFSCTSAGGTWNTEFYVDSNILKQDSWCEMTGMFDVSQGTGTNNKVNCDTSCWACEFQNNGTAWSSVSDAELACGASALGYCKWTNSSSAFNSKGFCDYPSEMSDSGAKDCNVDCGGCDFVNDPETACTGSMANNGSGCNWVSEGDNNYCVPKTKKICSTDCFSCFNVDACQNSSISCSWDTTFGLCSPSGFTGEICFDMIDNDADTLVDCSDPDCGFDNFCGGSSFGGDCFAETTAVGCNGTLAFGALNCTWINDTWNPTGWCDMPGANCWKFDNDLTTCGLTSGCTNETSSMGSNSWCEMNMTKVDNANCWGNNNETACNLGPNCKWQNDTWCQDNPADTWCIANPNAGYCDYAPFATCYNLNEAPCTANINCTWNSDIYSNAGGWCEIACFNYTLDESECTTAGLNGLCEWRDASATCQPETFMMFGTSGVTGKTGCWQYDGNYTDCNLKNVTCTYKNDSYSNNNVSENEPSGWCMDKAEFEHFGEMEGDIIDLAFDPDNIMGAAEAGVSGVVDIMGMGMRVTDSGFDFGAGVYNMTSSMMCNGYGIGNPENPFAVKIPGTGNATTEFHWYLDTNGVESGECVAVPASGTNLTGFDFLISYVSRNTTNGVVETKQLKRCLSGSWVPTNALISTSKKLSCGDIGGVMVAVSKQDLEGFSDYNKSANMRIFMSSAGDGNSRLIPSDSVGLGYYTQGTIDFGFVDCSDPSMAKDSKCKNFQKFGFNVFEECKNGVDDDENGLVDCDDPFCSFIPDCASGAAFNFVVDSNDVVAPVVVFSDIEKLYDSAFVRVDTSEPSNLSLDFYRNDSTCMTLNLSLDDLGVDAYQANSNYKPFHSVDLFSDTLGYSLTNNTVYYYKIRVCDPSSNCGISACSNFTTKATSGEKSFIFKVDLPAGYTIDIPALNKTGYNFSESFGGTWYDVGIKTNTSVTKNMNMTIHCGDMSIGFFGMNILSPTGIDLTDAFICNEVSNLMGMNSSLKKWNSLINNLHLGGATDYIEITIPIAYSASNTFSWTNDIGASGQDVDDYVSCSDGGSSNTVCKVPVSMGFSAYTVVTPAADTPASSDSGGGGGGAMAATPSNNTAENNESASNEVPDEDDGDSIGDVANKVVDKIKEIVSGDKKNWAFGVIAVVLIGVIAGVIYFIRKRKSA